MITISLQLRILPPDKIIVPGCEPTTYSSSPTLAKNLRCGSVIVSLQAALDAIPGSRVMTIEISGGLKNRFFELPPRQVLCPGACPVDYYEILRSIATEVAEEPTDTAYCDVINKNFCGDDDDIILAPPSTYQEEGSLSILGLH